MFHSIYIGPEADVKVKCAGDHPPERLITPLLAAKASIELGTYSPEA